MLNGNQLSWDIPLMLGSLTKPEYLDLSAPTITNSIPRYIGNLLKLNYLNISNNKFSQGIPVDLCNLAHLSQLDLSYNSLKGEIVKLPARSRLAPLCNSQRFSGMLLESSFECLFSCPIRKSQTSKTAGPLC